MTLEHYTVTINCAAAVDLPEGWWLEDLGQEFTIHHPTNPGYITDIKVVDHRPWGSFCLQGYHAADGPGLDIRTTEDKTQTVVRGLFLAHHTDDLILNISLVVDKSMREPARLREQIRAKFLKKRQAEQAKAKVNYPKIDYDEETRTLLYDGVPMGEPTISAPGPDPAVAELVEEVRLLREKIEFIEAAALFCIDGRNRIGIPKEPREEPEDTSAPPKPAEQTIKPPKARTPPWRAKGA